MTVTTPLMIACSTDPMALTTAMMHEPMARKTLWIWMVLALHQGVRCQRRTYARDDGTHIGRVGRGPVECGCY